MKRRTKDVFLSVEVLSSFVFDLVFQSKYQEAADLIVLSRREEGAIELKDILICMANSHGFPEVALYYSAGLRYVNSLNKKKETFNNVLTFCTFLGRIPIRQREKDMFDAVAYKFDAEKMMNPDFTDRYERGFLNYPEDCIYPIWIERFRKAIMEGDQSTGLSVSMALLAISKFAMRNLEIMNSKDLFPRKDKLMFKPESVKMSKMTTLNKTPFAEVIDVVARLFYAPRMFREFKSMMNTLDPAMIGMAICYTISKKGARDWTPINVEDQKGELNSESLAVFFKNNMSKFTPTQLKTHRIWFNPSEWSKGLGSDAPDFFNYTVDYTKSEGESPFIMFYFNLNTCMRRRYNWEDIPKRIIQQNDFFSLSRAQTDSLKTRVKRRLVSTDYNSGLHKPLFVWLDDPDYLYRGPYSGNPLYVTARMEIFRLFGVEDRVVPQEVITDADDVFWIRSKNMAPKPTTVWKKFSAGFDSYRHDRVDLDSTGLRTLSKMNAEEYAEMFANEGNLMVFMLKLIFDMQPALAFRDCVQHPDDPRKVLITDACTLRGDRILFESNSMLHASLLCPTSYKPNLEIAQFHRMKEEEVRQMLIRVTRTIRGSLDQVRLIFHEGIAGMEETEKYLEWIEQKI